MAKILLIGDPHLKISKFDLSCKFLDWVYEVAKQHKPDIVINLGDTFDTHAVVRSEIMSEFKNHILQITQDLGLQYYYVLGNHDMYKPSDSKYHALQPFKGIDKFIVVDEIMETHGNITLVPYQHDLSKFPRETQEICIAHQTFIGADYGFYRPDIGVDADHVSAEIIISGHIHKRQAFGKVVYPGTPFAQNADDADQAKGLALFDTKTYEFKFIESPFPKYRRLKLELNQEFSVKDLHTSMEESLNDKDHWIVELVGNRIELNAYLDSDEFKLLRVGKSLRVKLEYTDKQKNTRIQIKSMSMDGIVKEYIDKVYDGAIDKGIIRNKALEILEKTAKK